LRLIYNEDYYYNLLRIQTQHAAYISKVRWDFISDSNPRYVLDYGSGAGFFKAFAPSHIHVDTYDIGPYTQTGIRRKAYDVICLWDVLEHLPKIDDQLAQLFGNTRYVALTIPVLPMGKDLEKWKHRKPGEHIRDFTNITDVILEFDRLNFKCRKINTKECPPREDIYSFLFERFD